jgi:hypothetical protein
MQPDPRATPVDERTFTVDGGRVVHETIDGETILIALDTGTYYSLTGSGPEMWALLCGGHPVGVACQALAERYPGHAEQAQVELRRLAQELESEGLLLAGEVASPQQLSAPSTDGSFTPPTLHRYTDMEYFLRLDPIHEVDPAKGWPVQADGATFG